MTDAASELWPYLSPPIYLLQGVIKIALVSGSGQQSGKKLRVLHHQRKRNTDQI